MTVADESLLNKVAAKLGEPPSYAEARVSGSLLTAAAASYGSQPLGDEVTQPTGFDPAAAALFEAVVESAFLVAHADGEFDDSEQRAFRHVVLAACGDRVAEAQMSALLADLGDLLEEDGLEKRLSMVARAIVRPEQQREVLRMAALIAHVSGGVSTIERGVLERLAREFGLDEAATGQALIEAERALSD